ncbi:MAG: HNH endonuclease, partial [Nostoc sp.]
MKHLDHITAHHQGGPTSINNGRGLCESCNYTAQTPDWRSRAATDGTGIIHTNTP